MSITFFPTAGEPEGVNLANGNAAAVFALLGITDVVDGEMDADTFRDRVCWSHCTSPCWRPR